MSVTDILGKFSRGTLLRASWTLIDQGFVSLGGFVINVVLARAILPADYGTFAIIYGTLLLLQVINTTLVYYPLTISMAARNTDRNQLLSDAFLLLSALMAVMAAAVAVGLWSFGEGKLIVSVLSWFLLWQVQEYLRRVLFAEFRHQVAILGDAISYLGQGAIVVLLMAANAITLPRVFLAMAATSAVAALIQFVQIKVRLRRPESLIRTSAAFWKIGGWSLVSSVVITLRTYGLFWFVAVMLGRASAAEFQAALNVVNLANPIMLGLCNIIPQTVAHQFEENRSGAWRSAAQYATLGFVPTILYYGVVVVAPNSILTLFYGAQSHYDTIGRPLAVLAVAFALNYVTEIICSFLHGINSAREALKINLVGSVLTLALAVPLTNIMGWIGVCVALLVANAVRLAMSRISLRNAVGHASFSAA